MQLLGQAEAAGILLMAAIHYIAERLDVLPRVVVKPDAPPGLQIDHGDLLAGAEVFDRLSALFRRYPVGDAAAIAAAIETEHQTGLFRRAAVNEGIHAQRAVGADQARLAAFQNIEPRTPHQRSIAENPEFTGALM